MILAVANACKYIHTFTRFAGELFGLLIAVLFFQQGVRGLRAEYRPETVHIGSNVSALASSTDGSGEAFASTHGEHGAHGENVTTEEMIADPDASHWLMFNGTWALFLAFGLVVSTQKLREAREWNFFRGGIRKFLAEYATFVTVMAWTGISFCGGALLPEGIPRRLKLAKTLEAPATDTWSTVNEMEELSGYAIGIAVVPALIITVMNVFDHNVSAQLAQVQEFKLKKPHAYHWDFFLQGLMTALCGACGILPVNGVIPQSPLHTKACAEIVPDKQGHKSGSTFRIREQRWTNLIQSLLCGVCLFITEALQQVPRSVLWGFFLYMALESLPGSQFFERMQLFITDKGRLVKIVKGEHNEYLSKVDIGVVQKFTACQFLGFAVCYGISQIPTEVAPVGIFFPVLIMVLVPLRIYVFPKWFSDHDLYYLDPRENATPPDDHYTQGYNVGTVAEIAADDSDVSDEDVLAEAGLGSGFNANVTQAARVVAEDEF